MSGFLPERPPSPRRCAPDDLDEEAGRLEYDIGLSRPEAEAVARVNCGCGRRFTRAVRPSPPWHANPLHQRWAGK